MEQVRQTAASARSWWSDLPAGRRAAILACVGVAIGGIVLLRILARPTYGTLFTELPPDDFNRVVSWLDTKQAPFRAEGADTVLVPEAQVLTTRAALAKEGIPSSGVVVGKEDLDKTSFSETRAQFEKRVQRMIEGEVTRTILQLEELKTAKVNIAFPETTPLFEEDKIPLTAAVQVTPRGSGAELARSTVDAIANIVASSVSGLAPERVAIVDSRGRRYRADEAQSGLNARDVAAHANERRDEETELEEDLTRSIARVTGPDNVRVVASLDLEWVDEIEERRELLPDPNGKPFRISEQTQEESYTGPGVAGGVPGTEPNVPTTPTGTPPTYPTATAQPINYSSTSSTVNNDFGEVKTRKQPLSPKVLKKSIGVFLNEGSVTAAEQARIQTTAEAAAGIDRARGDTLVVQRVPFEDIPEPTPPRGGSPFLRYLVPALIALIGLIAPVLLTRMASPPKRPAVEPLEEPLEEGGPPAPEPLAWDGLFEQPALSEEEMLRQEENRREEATLEYVRRAAMERPGDVAGALRAWLVDH